MGSFLRWPLQYATIIIEVPMTTSSDSKYTIISTNRAQEDKIIRVHGGDKEIEIGPDGAIYLNNINSETDQLNKWIAKVAWRLHLMIGGPPWNEWQLQTIYDHIDAACKQENEAFEAPE